MGQNIKIFARGRQWTQSVSIPSQHIKLSLRGHQNTWITASEHVIPLLLTDPLYIQQYYFRLTR